MVGKKFRKRGDETDYVFLAVSHPGDTRGKGGVYECQHSEVEGLTVIVYEGDVHMASQVDGELAICKLGGATLAMPMEKFREEFEEVEEGPVEVAIKTPDQLRSERRAAAQTESFAKAYGGTAADAAEGGQDAGTHEETGREDHNEGR